MSLPFLKGLQSLSGMLRLKPHGASGQSSCQINTKKLITWTKVLSDVSFLKLIKAYTWEYCVANFSGAEANVFQFRRVGNTYVAEMNFAAREQENVFAPKLITPKLTPNF